MKSAKPELIILIAWHDERDEKKVQCFEENRRTIEVYNPDVQIFTVKSTFADKKIAWLSSDLTLFNWFSTNKDKIKSERYLLLEWDCWCDMNLKDYFKLVWNCDVVGPSVKYPERDTWDWFRSIDKLPQKAQLFATGIVPFCGILLSERAMLAIHAEILKDEYEGLNSEMRLATIATMCGFDPVPNPVCSRIITWKGIPPFEKKYKGLHHPRKTLGANHVASLVKDLLKCQTREIPKIIHQTWKDDQLPENIKALSETWKEHHPDWLYVLWTDDMNREFIKLFYPDFLLLYDSYETNIQRVDAVRYFILHKVGGVFVDLDFECLGCFEQILSELDCVFALEPHEHCRQFGKEKIICNAFMASKPNNNFMTNICNALPKMAWKNDQFVDKILATTGPFALTEIYDNYPAKNEVAILPSGTVYPLTVDETRRLAKGEINAAIEQKIDNALALHFFWGTWYSKS